MIYDLTDKEQLKAVKNALNDVYKAKGKIEVKEANDIDCLIECSNIIEWYRGIGKGFNDVDTFLYQRKMLSCHFTDLAELTGNLKAELDAAEHQRKTTFYKKELYYFEAGENGAKSKTKAENAISELREKEAQARMMYSRFSLIYNSTKEVLSTMSQQISYLKREKHIGTHEQNA